MLNVRDTEKLVKSFLETDHKKERKTEGNKYSHEISKIEETLKEIFGTKVKLDSNKDKGKIMKQITHLILYDNNNNFIENNITTSVTIQNNNQLHSCMENNNLLFNYYFITLIFIQVFNN